MRKGLRVFTALAVSLVLLGNLAGIAVAEPTGEEPSSAPATAEAAAPAATEATASEPAAAEPVEATAPAPVQVQNVAPPPQLNPRAQIDSIRATVIPIIFKLISAIAILIIGYIIAKFLQSTANFVVGKTGLNKRLASAVGGEAEMPFDATRTIGELVFWIVMLFTLVTFFDALGLEAITDPLNRFLGTVLQYLPRLIGAAIIFLVALIIASLARWGVTTGLQATKIDEILLKKTGVSEEDARKHTVSLGKIVYSLVLLLFLPAILDSLQMNGLLGPVQSMVDKAIGILPNIFGAGVILVIGWFIAKLVRQICANLLSTSGLDTTAEKLGLGKTGAKPLSEIVGILVYTLILIPVIIAALNALQITAISEPATRMLEMLLRAVPKLFGAALVLIISYFVARLVGELVTTLLAGIGFNNILKLLGLGEASQEKGKTPSDVVGYLVVVGILLFAAIEAAQILGFSIVAYLLAQFITFAGKVALAVVVLAVGIYLSKVAHTIVSGAAGPLAPVTAQVARIAIIVFASAMALRQTGIADDIVNLTFAFLIGTVAVAAALAFGLGCRDIAARAIEDAIQKFRKD